jgi:lyso-ornithine lipid O-acyltransferase
VSATWSAAAPPDLPPLRAIDRLRLVLRGGAAAVWTAALFAAFLGLRGIDLWARAIALRPLPALAPWVVHLWGFGALALLGLRYRQRGTPMRGPGALVANHASWIDIVVLMRAMRVFFVSKSEVAGWPAIGLIGRVIGTVFIARRPLEARAQTATLHARLRRGDRLCLFPEGTSSDGQRVLGFKSSLFEVFLAPDLRGVLRIQPISIVYRPRPGLPASFYGWWGEMDFGAHLASVLARGGGGVVMVEFHGPLAAGDFAGRKALAEEAERCVRAGFEAAGQRTGQEFLRGTG